MLAVVAIILAIVRLWVIGLCLVVVAASSSSSPSTLLAASSVASSGSAPSDSVFHGGSGNITEKLIRREHRPSEILTSHDAASTDGTSASFSRILIHNGSQRDKLLSDSASAAAAAAVLGELDKAPSAIVLRRQEEATARASPAYVPAQMEAHEREQPKKIREWAWLGDLPGLIHAVDKDGQFLNLRVIVAICQTAIAASIATIVLLTCCCWYKDV